MIYTVTLHLPLTKALSSHAVTVSCPQGCSTWGQVELTSWPSYAHLMQRSNFMRDRTCLRFVGHSNGISEANFLGQLDSNLIPRPGACGRGFVRMIIERHIIAIRACVD